MTKKVNYPFFHPNEFIANYFPFIYKIKNVKDKHLFALVFGVMTLDSVVMISWQVIDPLQRKTIYYELEVI